MIVQCFLTKAMTTLKRHIQHLIIYSSLCLIQKNIQESIAENFH